MPPNRKEQDKKREGEKLGAIPPIIFKGASTSKPSRRTDNKKPEIKR